MEIGIKTINYMSYMVIGNVMLVTTRLEGMRWDEKTNLNIHHLRYTQKLPFNEPKENLITVCEHCHKILEYFKENFNVEKIVKLRAYDGIKLFFVLCSDKMIYITLLTEANNIVDIAALNTSCLGDIHKSFTEEPF